MLVIRHLNKAAANNPLYRGGGIIGIIGAARMAFVVGKDPQGREPPRAGIHKEQPRNPATSLMFGLEEAEGGSVMSQLARSVRSIGQRPSRHPTGPGAR